MEGFLTFILFVVLGFYLLGWIGRSMLRHWLQKKQQEFSRGGNPFFRQQSEGNPQRGRPEGEVTIRQSRTTGRKKVSRDVGEYVTYEEVTVESTEESNE